MEFIILWTICAVVCALIANAKRRSPWAWLALGFLFGLFAVVAVAVMPSIEPDTMPCPYCKELIKKDATTCRHCRTVLNSPPPPGNPG